MKRTSLQTATVAVLILGAPVISWAQAKAPAATGKSESPAKAATPAVVQIPKSVFSAPANAGEGRNPFFPESTPVLAANQTQPAATGKQAVAPVVDLAPLVLNGITSPPRRTAMINGRTFEPGEEAEIKLPTGARLLVKCVEIRDGSAIIDAGGVRRELKLRFAL